MSRKPIPVEGRYGSLTVLDSGPIKDKTRKHRSAIWRVRCDCGKEFGVKGSELASDKKTCCKDCTWKHFTGPNNWNWTGCGDITGARWAKWKDGAYSRGHAWDITIEYGWTLFQQQCGKCALSRMDISLRGKRTTASLDRIDSTKGYLVGNVQWLHRDINLMKQKFDEAYFVEMCAAVVRTASQYKGHGPDELQQTGRG